MGSEHEDVERAGGHLSRRSVLKRIGAGAAIAWSAPVLTSLSGPAWAQSYVCTRENQFNCGGAFVTCGTGQSGTCFCDVDTEGNTGCFDNLDCGTFPACTDSSTCPQGTRCVPGTCCGPAVCLRDCGANGNRVEVAQGGQTPLGN